MVTNKANIINVAQLAKGQEAAFNKFLPLALAIPANELQAAHDPHTALVNVNTGAEAILNHPDFATVGSLLTAEQVQEVLELANATVFASTLPLKEEGTLRPLLNEAVKLREVLLKAADSAASVDRVPRSEVEEIRKGRGLRDRASDCVQLAALFRRYAPSLEGATVVKPEQIARADELGTYLLNVLGTRRSRPKVRLPSVSQEQRNRLWTLLVRRHNWMRRVAVVLFDFGGVDEKVPPLRAHVQRRVETPTQPGTKPVDGTPPVDGAKPVDGKVENKPADKPEAPKTGTPS